jgi:hypothetical protein
MCPPAYNKVEDGGVEISDTNAHSLDGMHYMQHIFFSRSCYRRRRSHTQAHAHRNERTHARTP